jgi:hypothetical protein
MGWWKDPLDLSRFEAWIRWSSAKPRQEIGCHAKLHYRVESVVQVQRTGCVQIGWNWNFEVTGCLWNHVFDLNPVEHLLLIFWWIDVLRGETSHSAQLLSFVDKSMTLLTLHWQGFERKKFSKFYRIFNQLLSFYLWSTSSAKVTVSKHMYSYVYEKMCQIKSNWIAENLALFEVLLQMKYYAETGFAVSINKVSFHERYQNPLRIWIFQNQRFIIKIDSRNIIM